MKTNAIIRSPLLLAGLAVIVGLFSGCSSSSTSVGLPGATVTQEPEPAQGADPLNAPILNGQQLCAMMNSLANNNVPHTWASAVNARLALYSRRAALRPGQTEAVRQHSNWVNFHRLAGSGSGLDGILHTSASLPILLSSNSPSVLSGRLSRQLVYNNARAVSGYFIISAYNNLITAHQNLSIVNQTDSGAQNTTAYVLPLCVRKVEDAPGSVTIQLLLPASHQETNLENNASVCPDMNLPRGRCHRYDVPVCSDDAPVICTSNRPDAQHAFTEWHTPGASERNLNVPVYFYHFVDPSALR